MKTRTINTLKQLGACDSAIEKAKSYQTRQEAWDKWDRPQDLMWYIFRVTGPYSSKSHRKACGVLHKTVLPCLKYVKKGEQRPAKALSLLKRYANGADVTKKQFKDAADAAYAAADAAYAYAAAAATAAAADAAAKTKQLSIIRKHYPTPPRARK